MEFTYFEDYEIDKDGNKIIQLIGFSENWNYGNNVQILKISGFGPFKEVLRGNSGICQFGASSSPISNEDADIIRKNKKWTQKKVSKRLRYTIRDGGKAFDSFKINFSIKRYIRNKLNLNQ